jgi:hypothetical protein
VSLFTFRRTIADRTTYLSRRGADALAETPDLNDARQFTDTTEYRAWLADLSRDEQASFIAKRWARADLLLTVLSPVAADAATRLS